MSCIGRPKGFATGRRGNIGFYFNPALPERGWGERNRQAFRIDIQLIRRRFGRRTASQDASLVVDFSDQDSQRAKMSLEYIDGSGIQIQGFGHAGHQVTQLRQGRIESLDRDQRRLC